MTSASKLTSFALSTYPSWWRERYQDEMVVVIQSLLDDGRSPLGVAINLLASSLRTRLVGSGAPASRRFWVHRTQRSLLVATMPWFAIVPLALTCYLSIGQYGFFHGSSTSVHLSRAGVVARALQQGMLYVVLAYVVVALVGWRRLRNGLEGQRFQMRWFRLVNRAAMVGITLVFAALFLGQHNATSSIAEACAIVGLVLFTISWFSLPVVITQMLRVGELPMTFLRAEVRLSAALAALSGVLALLAVGDRVALSLQPTPLPGASYWMYRSSIGMWDVPLLIGLLLLTIVSARGAVAARRSYIHTVST